MGEPEVHHKAAILIVLALTYVGIALGHVPGLKLNRTGIALLGAIGMMLFGGVSTTEVVKYVNCCLLYTSFLFGTKHQFRDRLPAESLYPKPRTFQCLLQSFGAILQPAG